jgi:hypothetical protein
MTGQKRIWFLLLNSPDGMFIAFVCLVNVLLRLPILLIDVTPASDFGWYFDRAQEIAAGAGYAQRGVPTAFWPVGWPGFLGGLLWVFGPHVVVGQLANLLFSTLVVCLVAIIGRRLFAEPLAWRLAALLIAVLPNQIGYVPLLSVEIFFEFLLLLGFLLVMSRSAAGVVGSGLVFGVAALTKSQAILLPAMIVLPVLDLSGGWRSLGKCLRIIILAGAGMMVVILPWTARNYAVFHVFIPVSTNGGFTLLTGNNPSARGGYTPNDPLVKDLSTNPLEQVQADRIARERAVDWIGQNPMAFVRLIPLKVWGMWAGDGEAEWMYQLGYRYYDRYVELFRSVRILNQILYWVVLGLAVASLPAMLRQRRSLSVWCYSGWALIGYFTAISVVFSGQSRFHFALMPFVALYAAWGLAARRTVDQSVIAFGGTAETR